MRLNFCLMKNHDRTIKKTLRLSESTASTLAEIRKARYLTTDNATVVHCIEQYISLRSRVDNLREQLHKSTEECDRLKLLLHRIAETHTLLNTLDDII